MGHAFRVSARSLEALEWPTLQEQLAQRCRTPMGRALAGNWLPSSLPDAEAGVAQARAVTELLSLAPARLPAGDDCPDIADLLSRVERSGAISVAEFRDLVNAHKSVQGVQFFVAREAARVPHVHELLKDLDLLKDWSRQIFPLLDARGEIADSASEDLRALRLLAENLREQIRKRLNDYLTDSRRAEQLQDFYVTLRDGRFVIPVKTNFKGRVPGIIHDVSKTENTMFIEPQEVVDANNQLKVTEKEIEIEIERILQGVVEATKPHVSALRANQERLALADLLNAAQDLTQAWGGECCVAEAGDNEVGLDFDRLRHPLLALQRQVVPNSFSWPQALILSGPNTGGKTVLLKSVGLAVCLARAGLPVPASRVQLPRLLGGVAADIGDEQDLHENLSTFSAHLMAMKEMIAQCQPGDLLLLDEIATGTSPEEGQPLAQALVEKFLELGARVFVTTHYGSLKQFAMVDRRCRIAAMAFDSKTRSPIYEIVLDVPGESSALESAEKVGLPADLIERARKLRGEAPADMREALAKLEEARGRLRQTESELQEQKARVAEQEERARKRAEEFQVKLREGVQEEARGVVKRFGELRDELSRLVKGASQEDLRAGATQLFTKISDGVEAVRSVSRDAAGGDVEVARPVDHGDLLEGSVVEVAGLGIGVVQETPKNPADPKTQVLVKVGELKTRVPRSSLFHASQKKIEKFKAERSSQDAARERREARSFQLKPATTASVCDVRGKSLDDALGRVEQALNDLSRVEHGSLTIVHGHGTGKLRDGIRDYIRTKRDDLVFRNGSWPGEGGDGVTVVERG